MEAGREAGRGQRGRHRVREAGMEGERGRGRVSSAGGLQLPMPYRDLKKRHETIGAASPCERCCRARRRRLRPAEVIPWASIWTSAIPWTSASCCCTRRWGGVQGDASVVMHGFMGWRAGVAGGRAGRGLRRAARASRARPGRAAQRLCRQRYGCMVVADFLHCDMPAAQIPVEIVTRRVRGSPGAWADARKHRRTGRSSPIRAGGNEIAKAPGRSARSAGQQLVAPPRSYSRHHRLERSNRRTCAPANAVARRQKYGFAHTHAHASLCLRSARTRSPPGPPPKAGATRSARDRARGPRRGPQASPDCHRLASGANGRPGRRRGAGA